MNKYTVYLTDNNTGATSPIDTITAPENYKANDYIKDCRKNADPEYIKMITNGKIELIKLDN